ncbi:MAG: ornithine--oxo-acid transaminase [Solibacterales bacterium]|nr:ornithine--oxo-acid transaminase [Bryobacterales bacterium]|tara:strand:- start:18007 stop:19212 length:1206 start_codon:yes stop_codon:yes gene_type:complete
MSQVTKKTDEFIALEDRWGAHNYHPLDIVVERAEGPWLYSVEGRRYLDCLSAYSAVNQGHCHPDILKALTQQAARVTLTSRAFRNNQLPVFCKKLASLCGLDAVVPMNTGAEAVETAIKAARRWGYHHKGIATDRAEIIVCENNFHGRTTTIVGFSSDSGSRQGFGPFAPGFVSIPFGDVEQLEAAINSNTCAFLVEPIQCEAGVRIPPDGFLREAAAICKTNDVLLLLDEIQTGLGRTGRMFCADHEDVRPDAFILGKALAGGFYPVSAVVGSKELIGVFDPGSHGSTYGGNPLGCAVALEALQVIERQKLVARSAEMGEWLLGELSRLHNSAIKEIRGRGLMVAIELHELARPYCEQLKEQGVLCKETHDRVIRIAPPLITERSDLEWAVDKFDKVFGV